MKMDPIPSADQAGAGTRRRRVDRPGPGPDGGPDAPAAGEATHRPSSERPFSLPRIAERSDPRAVRGPGPGRSSLEHVLGDEVARKSYLVLANDTALIPGLLAELDEAAARLGLFDETTAGCVAVALTEALVNGIQHGNLELDSRLRQDDEKTYFRIAEFRRGQPPYRDRRLHVRARLSRRGAVYVIRDEGPGFDPSRLPDPTDPANLERAGGRGLFLIRAYMDEVAFNRAGNRITLIKRRTATPNALGR
jgi:anti-sigma regulatory factor (Ser/Thr protein kinase)